MFKELIEQRNLAKEVWDKARKEIQPLEDEYWKYVELIDKKFIEEKVYIPIEKADEFLKGKKLSSIRVVFEDGDYAELYNDYDVYWDSDKQCFDSGCNDSGYTVQDTLRWHPSVVGFYDAVEKQYDDNWDYKLVDILPTMKETLINAEFSKS